ncbi:MAG: peptidylprolyl isomerase [bacterium]
MNRLKSQLLVLLVIAFAVPVIAQVNNNETLMTIAGKKVTVGEFLTIYQKNNGNKDKTEGKSNFIDRKSLDEYLDLFINFKLKVKEAEELGLDTLTSFRNELNGYRDQLAKPYFTDEATLDNLLTEAWERSKYDIRASHIFFRLKQDALPADTLAAYNKAIKISERATNGEMFEKLAVTYSEDPSAKDREANQQHPLIKGNMGDLGFFTVFDMVYAFENAAYTTPVGKVSGIVRTDYGYHIIKVTEKRPAFGKVVVAHIFLALPKAAKTEDSLRVKLRIDSIYQKLKNGAKFEDLVKQYSEDKGSAAKGGVLPKFGVNRMVPEFIDAIYTLSNVGDYSKPTLTPYGWHIIKLVERKTPGALAEEKTELKQKVVKDSRGNLPKEVVMKKIRKEYSLTEYPEAKAEFYKIVTDTIFFGKWDAAVARDMVKPLFKIGTLTVRQKEFADYLASKQRKRDKEPIELFVNKMYSEFLDDNLIKWENSHLEQKYPEFKALMGEYRDGILLFDLTDKKVWSKAVKDTTGLKEFYEKNKSNYMWDTRVDASIYTLKKEGNPDKVKNFITSGLSDTDLLKEINTDSLKLLSIENGKFSKHDNKLIDGVAWQPGFSKDMTSDSATVFIYIRSVLKPEPKALSEARGLITADYQNFLEKEWIRSLREKYKVVVNREVLAKIK